MSDFDLFVIGAGSGGVRAARVAADLGARVAIAEDLYMGGTCVNVGCVPKKLYSYAAHFSSDFSDAAGFGWNVQKPAFNWQILRDNKRNEIARLNGIYDSLLDKAGVTVVNGHGCIKAPGIVAVGDQQYTAEKILIATGGWPFVPELPGSEYILSSNEIFDLEVFPERILIVGGGYIAVEFAGIFAGLGAQTSLCYRGEMLLRGFDEETRRFFFSEMQKHVRTLLQTDVKAVRQNADGAYQVTYDNGTEEIFDAVLYATGRVPNTRGLGLENTKITTAPNGTIKIDDNFSTEEPGIYAVGDVVGYMALTPVALAEGMALSRHLFGKEPMKTLDYNMIPTAVFSHPNIATVGLSEEKAKDKYEIDVFTSDFKHLKHTLSGSDERTFMKIIVDKATDKVIGMHMVGDQAGEIIQGFAAAITAGVTKTQLDNTIGIHPTAAEEFVTMRQPRS